MAEALDRLAEGLEADEESSAAVGRGQFDAEYTRCQRRTSSAKPSSACGTTWPAMSGRWRPRSRSALKCSSDRPTSFKPRRRSASSTRTSPPASTTPNAFKVPSCPAMPSPRASSTDTCLYMLRDGVSGDFPWFHKLDAWRLMAAVDCTGHGVPGAFMSSLGHNALQHIGKVYTQPGKILDRLNEMARNVLHRGEGQPRGGKPGARRHGSGTGFHQPRGAKDGVRRRQLPGLSRAQRRSDRTQARQTRHCQLRARRIQVQHADRALGGWRHSVLRIRRISRPIRRAQGRKFMRKRFRSMLAELSPPWTGRRPN